MKKNKGWFYRFLDGVERVGNKLPDPFILFIILSLIVIAISWVASMFNASVIHPGTGEELAIKNLASGEGIQFILTSTLTNFTGFAPLGLVLVMMFGIGLAEKVGLLDHAIRKTILQSPPKLVTYTVVFVGIIGNIVSDASIVLIPPLAAYVFHKMGRHPLAGLAAGFAGAGAGFTANLFIAGKDVLLSGIATEAAQIMDANFVVTPVDNWYFNIVSVFLLTLVGGLITTRIIEQRLGTYQNGDIQIDDREELPDADKGLRNAGIAGLIYIALIVLVIMLPNSPLRNEEGGLVPSPFISGIVPILLLFFVTMGCAYGITVGKIKSSKDISRYMAESVKELSGYIVLVFAIAQFIAYFNWSNLGIWIAVNGAEFLQDINFTGIGLIVAYSLFTALLDFIITSGSAKWALEAPIFIPMFMQLGYHPAFTQVAYRIADSSINVVTPLSPYMIIILSFMKRYDKNAGIGSYISLMLPYAVGFLVTWIILLLIFYFTGMPIGPGITPHL